MKLQPESQRGGASCTYLELFLCLEARGGLCKARQRCQASRDAGRHTNFFQLGKLSVLACVWPCGATYASRMCSGMLDSTALMSPAPKPVAVRMCLGLEKPGPTGPVSVEMGAPIEGLRSRGAATAAAIVSGEGQG
jgi:hypothetical protein